MFAYSWHLGLRRKLKDWSTWWPVNVWSNVSWSQEGEDLLLQRILGDKPIGFYIDVGAHHPERFSNTCLFYRRGWKGINIDSNEDSIKLFRRRRPRDINVCATVHKDVSPAEFVRWRDSALDGIDNGLQINRPALTSEEPSARVRVWPRLLREILEENMPANTPIDFLSVDVEGEELAVLASNDWAKYRPRYVLVEETAQHYLARNPGSVRDFLEELDYRLIAMTLNTQFYELSNPSTEVLMNH